MAEIATLGFVGIFLCASLTVNLALFSYFFIFAVADLFVKLCHAPVSRLRLAHKHCTDFMRNFYFENVFYSILAIAAIVITIVFYQLDLSFQGDLYPEVQLFFAAAVAFHVFVFLRIVFLANHNLAKYTVLMMRFMVLLCLVGVLVTNEDAPLGMIFLISEADVCFANVAKLHKVMRLKGTRRYQIILYVGTLACVLSRAIIPLGYLSLALVNGSPLKMSVSSVTVFFVGLVACGAINTWKINAAISRLCRKEERIIEVPYANMTGTGNNTGPKPEDIATISANMEVPPSYNDVFGATDIETSASDALSFSNPLAEDTQASADNITHHGNDSDVPQSNTDTVVDIPTLELTNQSDITEHGSDSAA